MSANYAPLLDDELMIQTLLDADLPEDITVAAEMDISSLFDAPILIYQVTSADQELNGPGLWKVYLTVDIFATDGTTGWQACNAAYSVIHTWSIPGYGVTLEGHVVTVYDSSTFTRMSTSLMQGKHVTQWTAAFELTVRSSE